jgi:hypothetical protein
MLLLTVVALNLCVGVRLEPGRSGAGAEGVSGGRRQPKKDDDERRARGRKKRGKRAKYRSADVASTASFSTAPLCIMISWKGWRFSVCPCCSLSRRSLCFLLRFCLRERGADAGCCVCGCAAPRGRIHPSLCAARAQAARGRREARKKPRWQHTHARADENGEAHEQCVPAK